MAKDTKTDIDNIAWFLIVVGAIVHLIMGLGQMALFAIVNPFLGLIQLIIGLSGLWVILRKYKLIK